MAGPPDLSPYVDLTLDDRTAQDLFDTFKVDALSRLPGWAMLDTDGAVAVAESYAQVLSELIFAVNRLPGALVEAVLRRLFQLPRDTGAPAQTSVTVHAADNAGHAIRAGTRFGLDTGVGVILTLTADVDTDIVAGATDVDVPVTADQVGATWNGTPTGTGLQLLDALAFVDSAVLATPLIGGRDPETGDAYLTRGAALFAQLTQVLVVPPQFTVAAYAVAGVGRAVTIDRYDPGTPGVAPNRTGHVSIVLTDGIAGPVSSGVKDAVTAALTPKMMGGLTLHLLDPTVTPVDVVVTVHRDSSADDTTVASRVAAALTAYLDPTAWPFTATVYRNELEFVARQVAGVDRVVTLTTPAADVVLGGVGPLPTAGTIAVNVVHG
jgi:uncharacterized phage protein gp47/JayE